MSRQAVSKDEDEDSPTYTFNVILGDARVERSFPMLHHRSFGRPKSAVATVVWAGFLQESKGQRGSTCAKHSQLKRRADVLIDVTELSENVELRAWQRQVWIWQV